MPARRRKPGGESSPGVHHLQSPAVLRAIMRSAELGIDDHVFDLGAGPGTLTAALSRTGARVTAVERDARYVQQLKRRFRRHERVAVLEADLRAVAIPPRARVVANIPFATSSALVSRLLTPAGAPRAGLELIVERGFAVRLAARLPRSPGAAWWSARYEIRIVHRVPRSAFAPAPRVDAALLRIRPREPLGRDAERRLRALLATAHRNPAASAASLARRCAGRRAGPAILRHAGLAAGTPAAAVEPWIWAEVARGPGGAGPPCPRPLLGAGEKTGG